MKIATVGSKYYEERESSEDELESESKRAADFSMKSRVRSSRFTMTRTSSPNFDSPNFSGNEELVKETSSSTSGGIGSARSTSVSYSVLCDTDVEVDSEDIGDTLSRLVRKESTVIPTKTNKVLNTKRGRFKNGTRHSMSFTNENFHEIERVNNILLKKIMNQKQKPISGMQNNSAMKPPRPMSTNLELSRRQQQRQISLENALIEKRIRDAKCRTTNRFS